jgi:hypothetical protein
MGMTQVAFARLIGVSQPMVSTYKAEGRLVLVGKRIDALPSLALLAGTLDETKRLQAIRALNDQAVESTHAAAEQHGVLTPKQEREIWAARSAQLQYATQAGALCEVSEVERLAADAFAELSRDLNTAAVEAAGKLTASLGLAPQKTPAIRRQIKAEIERGLSLFAKRMTALADAAAQSTRSTAAAQPNAAPLLPATASRTA